MQNHELGTLTDAEIELIKRARVKPAAAKQDPTQEQINTEKRARFQKLVGTNAGGWSKEDQAFMRDECMKDLLAGRLPFGG